jgi:hypothetical protein
MGAAAPPRGHKAFLGAAENWNDNKNAQLILAPKATYKVIKLKFSLCLTNYALRLSCSKRPFFSTICL